MGRRPAIWVLALFIGVVSATFVFGAGTAGETSLRDGSILTGVDGKLARPESGERSTWSPDRCFFEFDSDVNDGHGCVKAGASLELLPSTTLEKMIVDAERRSGNNYRLWARVTKYKGRNFVFPTYFLALGEMSAPGAAKLQESQQQETKPEEKGTVEPAINEPNDVLSIPQEIIEKLKTRRIVRTERFGESPRAIKDVGKEAPGEAKRRKLKRDSMLADRIGFIGKSRGEVGFVLNALGRNDRQVWFGLLPCEALERAEGEQSKEVERLRFKVAGIVTEYKGRRYLLLQKAVRVYSHGNFGR
jgi:hypothetical protein